jgi:hypothetical protein
VIRLLLESSVDHQLLPHSGKLSNSNLADFFPPRKESNKRIFFTNPLKGINKTEMSMPLEKKW